MIIPEEEGEGHAFYPHRKIHNDLQPLVETGGRRAIIRRGKTSNLGETLVGVMRHNVACGDRCAWAKKKARRNDRAFA